jgi:hypothetical protein
MKHLLFILPLLFLAMACNQKKDSDNSLSLVHQFGLMNGTCYDYTTKSYATPTSCNFTSGYYLNNGVCTSVSTGQPANTNYCSTTNNSPYYWSNGNCLSVYNNQPVAPSLCTTASTTAQCYGNYIWNYQGTMRPTVCSGANCSGFTLIEASTGRQVVCQ